VSALGFRRSRACYCRGNPCVCASWEGKLRRAGLGHLEYEDSQGNVLLGNRGAGKLADAAAMDARAGAEATAAANRAKRLVILQHARFGRVPAGGRHKGGRTAPRHLDRKIWELYAAGAGYKRIASDLKLPRATVRHRIAEVWRIYGHLAAPPGLAGLVRECEPGTLALFFGLLRRATEQPAEVAAMLDEAEALPELRAILDGGKP
jgi:hypothetical protein